MHSSKKRIGSSQLHGGERPDVAHLFPAKPTEVYETYWRFAVERQAIFYRRLEGHPPPWTSDLILSQFKFTNAYRASDRVSQYLIRNIIYSGDSSINEMFFRILLFKIFNKIETWELLSHRVGPVSFLEYSFRAYDKVLTEALLAGQPIYSAAYIMASAGSKFGLVRKHQNHLKVIERMMEDHLPERIAESNSMQKVYDMLRSYPSIGEFLAYQYAIDINYSPLTNFSEMDFVVAGPGALDGLSKCFSDFGGLTEIDIIKLIADRQTEECERLGLSFRSLWGRRLQLIDCQNLFCEVGKYARVAHPDAEGVSGRTRIKQRFKPQPKPILYFYPPKWGLVMSMKPGEKADDNIVCR